MAADLLQMLRVGPIAPRRITVTQYHRMIRANAVMEGEPVELLDGLLIQRPRMEPAHAACQMRLNEWFILRLRGRAICSVRHPIPIPPFSELEPDIVLLPYREDFYGTAHPGPEEVLLAIEISDVTLAFDRDIKLPRYAAAGITESWIADVKRNRLTVYRDPTPDGYRQVLTLTRRATISPLAFPDLELRWEDIFGRP
jgi:Uma2 family endonuclease